MNEDDDSVDGVHRNKANVIAIFVRSGTKPCPRFRFLRVFFSSTNFPPFSSRIFRSSGKRGRYDGTRGKRNKARFTCRANTDTRLGRSVYVLTASAADRLVSSRLVVAQTLMTSLSLIRIPIVAAAVFTGAPLHLAATVPLFYVPRTTTTTTTSSG